jgi:hypothetical protein
VQVDSVLAIASQVQNGRWNVTFAVTFENVGNSPIHAIRDLSALDSFVATNSSVLQKAPSPQCGGTIAIITLNHGQNNTVYTPDCTTGFNYQLIHPGTVDVRLTFNWTTNLNPYLRFSNSTTISARFTFA